MTTEDKIRQYVADKRGPRPDKPANLDQPLAAFLAKLVPRPDGFISVSEFVALFRASLRGHKQRTAATRGAIVEALERLGVLTGLTHDGRRIVIGYAIDTPAALTVDDTGRIRKVA
jgi:hypothetical protein